MAPAWPIPPPRYGRFYAPELSFDSGSSVRPAKYCGVTPRVLASLRTVEARAFETPRSNLFMLVKWRPLIWANSFWVKKLRWRVSLSLPSCPSSTRAITSIVTFFACSAQFIRLGIVRTVALAPVLCLPSRDFI